MQLYEFWNYPLRDLKSTKIEFNGTEKFLGGITSGSKYLWYDNGSVTIPLVGIETLEQLEEICTEYLNGNYVCCRCKKLINAKNKKNYEKWFSGIFCKDCWTDEDEIERYWDYKNLD